MSFDYTKYLRMEKMPHMWCPGCGIGIIVKAMIRAIDKMEWDKNDTAVISGIGCTSRSPGYLDMNTLHTTHGRALTFATGMKLVRPDKHVVVISGDGDATAIGGNHFIHTCRRNIDITLIIVNNYIYGMTGGQYSPTTPTGTKAATAPYGNYDQTFDLVELAKGAGATYVARGQVNNGLMIEKFIYDGMKHHGFSVIEVVSNCHTQYGRRNRMGDIMDMLNYIKEHAVNLKKAQKMTPEELKDKFIIGKLHQVTDIPEYTDQVAACKAKVMEAANK